MNGIDHGMEINKLLIDLKIKLSIPHIPLFLYIFVAEWFYKELGFFPFIQKKFPECFMNVFS